MSSRTKYGTIFRSENWYFFACRKANDSRSVYIDFVDGKPKVEWEPKTNRWTGAEIQAVLKGAERRRQDGGFPSQCAAKMAALHTAATNVAAAATSTPPEFVVNYMHAAGVVEWQTPGT